MATVFKIHPAIGVARVGSSDAFYVAPETTGGLPTDRQGHLQGYGDGFP